MADSPFFQPDCVCSDVVNLYKNRDRTIRFTITNEDVGDITGALIWFSVKKEVTDTDSEAVITKKSTGITGGDDSQAKVVDGVARIIEVYVLPADTVDLDAGGYVSDAVIQLPTGRKLQLKDPFRFNVQQPATLAETP